MPLTLRFWGVRGSIPTPESDHLGVGGETSCVEVSTPDQLFIIDAGTGIRNCGRDLLNRNGSTPRDIWILLSHFHWDHLQGLPFFAPLYRPEFRIRFLHSGTSEATRDKLRNLMRPPFFPVDWDNTGCQKEFHSLPPEGTLLDGVELKPFPLHHPQGATGYAIRCGSSPPIVYASDCEHGDPAGDASVTEASAGAAAVIYDAQYTPEEYEHGGHRGWGHSTWKEGARMAAAAGAERLFLFHHDPSHTDSAMLAIQGEARKTFPRTDVAVQGTSFVVG
ncbi:MAG: MBL fold metallo-hydrolase [Bryobacteraceae bacterium]|nr:MBL fold metallo-hydrolase [Bryobacteraceae bacterium]